MRKKILEKKLARLNAKKLSLNTRCQASSDVNEVRELTEQLEDINAEIEETQAEIDAINEDERSAQAEMEAREVPAQAQLVNGNVTAAFQTAPIVEQKRDENPTASMEYRQAFMNYIQKGTPIPAEARNGEVISTAESGAAIPITVMNEVINTVRKRYGNLYSKVRKLSVPGGVEIPIGSLEASFKWVNESTVSPRQKVSKLGKISFGYHTAEIMNGSGEGSRLGVLNDPRVTNTITMTAAKMNNWTAWRKDFFAQIPLGYRAGEFVFAASTVDAYLETMADSNNNPIFRQATGLEVNDGDAVNPNGRFFGREIAMVEPDIIADFDSASAGDVIGLFWQPNEYAINENFGFTMRRYFDEETNEWVDKALVVVDGKVLNPTGFYKIVKG